MQQVTIGTREFTFYAGISPEDRIYPSFLQLARSTFALDFAPWFKLGCGRREDGFCPFLLADGDHVCANISFSEQCFSYQGKVYHYVQLGSVMTDPAYRGLGLSAFLMRTGISHYSDKADGLFLFANDSVTKFYPKFGFERRKQVRSLLRVPEETPMPKKAPQEMDLRDPYLLQLIQYGKQPYSLKLMDGFDLARFYLLAGLEEHFYWCDAAKAAVLCAYEGDTLKIREIYSEKTVDPEYDICQPLLRKGIKRVEFDFLPDKAVHCHSEEYEEEGTTLFVLPFNETAFDHPLGFSLLSHT